MLFEGILLSVMSDTGPSPEINLTKLDETTAMKLAISLLTALGLGESRDQLNQLHGSFPVPGRKELALAYPFVISGAKSHDPRIREHGRYCTLFLLFKKENKAQVLSQYEIIEQILGNAVETLNAQEDLTPELLQQVHSFVEGKITSEAKEKHNIEPTTVSAEEMARFREEQLRQQQLTSLIRDVTQVQTALARKLDEYMVFTDTPVREGSFYMRPQIKPSDYLSVFPLITSYEKSLARLDGEDETTVREIVDISVLVRMGNLFYWKALSSQQNAEFEKAISYYLRANRLKDDSILYLTIGSIYRKMGRPEEAKDWIESGFSRMRQRGESIRISRNMLFGDLK
ncbi:MAG: tetratricopeptide repeat protein [Candidatus Thorarchaeota archaeon]